MIQFITSKQNQKIKYCLKLHQQSFRDQEQKFLIEGEHLLEMALQNNDVLEVYCLKERSDLPSSVGQFVVNEDILNKISFSIHPQGVIAVCQYPLKREIRSNRVLLF